MRSDTGSDGVFVYGTLRPGASNAFRMEGAEWCGAGEVAGRLYRISWYPGWVRGSGRVRGDVFRVGPELLAELDVFEGPEYQRVRVDVLLTESGGTLPVWAYEWTGPVEEAGRIVSGDWLAE